MRYFEDIFKKQFRNRKNYNIFQKILTWEDVIFNKNREWFGKNVFTENF